MNSPFEGLTKSQVNKLFELLGVHIYKYDKNQELIPTIRNENIIGIIISGCAQIINIEYNGNEILIEELVPNSIFGTNISGTNNENYQIIAKQDTQVVIIDYNKLLNPKNSKYSYFNIFIKNIFDIINIKFKEKNERIRILEKKQIRDKLLEFFEIEHKKGRLKYIYLPFSFRALADYLGVNRSAMFRELRHLKDEKLIEITDRKITLLYKQQ